MGNFDEQVWGELRERGHSFGAPFYGSLGANPPSAPIIGMAPSTDGNGYYMLGSPGSVYSFGDAPYLGGAS